MIQPIIDTTNERAVFTVSGKRLRRARRLYIYLVSKACLADASGETLTRCVDRAIDCGLYAKATYPNDVRWSFLRNFWGFSSSGKKWGLWHRWISEHRHLLDPKRRRWQERWDERKAA